MNVEWLLTEQCNFKCDYCGLYNNMKVPETDHKKIETFLIEVKAHQLVDEFDFFIFGGEPFLHPEIKHIINELHRLDIRYTFQTNGSKKSVDIMLKLADEYLIEKFNISIHTSEQSLDEYIEQIRRLQSKKTLFENLQNIEIMFWDIENFEDYRKLKTEFPEANIILCPVSDFLVEGFGNILTMYNLARNSEAHNDIQFEDIEITYEGRTLQRSILWQEFIEGKISPKGKPCFLKNKFLMFDSHMNKYNCCFHAQVDDNNCPYDTCFLS